MLIVSLFYFVTREAYFTSLFLSLALAVLGLLLVMRRLLMSDFASLALVALLVSSKAFVDFTVSGLENPLTHAFLAVFLVRFVRGVNTPREMFVLTLLASLAAVNRLDTILFFVPCLLYSLWTSNARGRALASTLVGSAPLVLWFVFSVFYYGFLFPNTYYAKINADIPASVLIPQGLCYLLNSLNLDPATLAITIVGVVSPILCRRTDLLPISGGILLYVAYVIYIGGDWMSGRFLTGPLFGSAVLLSYCWCRVFNRTSVGLISALVVLGLASPYSPLLSHSGYGAKQEAGADAVDANGIEDVRATHYKAKGLLNVTRRFRGGIPDYRRFPEGQPEELMVIPLVGIPVAFHWGPKVHVIDRYGLADPLLARIPMAADFYFRIAHRRRDIPPGYRTTLKTGKNTISDPNLAAYYDKLSHVVRGDLFSLSRIAEIWRINTGAYDYLLDAYAESVVKHNEKRSLDWSEFRGRRTRRPPG